MHYASTPFEAQPECLEGLKLNALIAGMDTPEKAGVVTDRDQAHEQALLFDPYMTKAIGYLALAAQRHKNYHRDVYGPRMIPALAPVHLIRESQALRRAKEQITAAYLAVQ